MSPQRSQPLCWAAECTWCACLRMDQLSQGSVAVKIYKAINRYQNRSLPFPCIHSWNHKEGDAIGVCASEYSRYTLTPVRPISSEPKNRCLSLLWSPWPFRTQTHSKRNLSNTIYQSMCKQKSCVWQPGSSQWCPAVGKEGEWRNSKFHLNMKKNFTVQ